MGDTPNVAARVQSLAEPGTVLVTAATHRLVSGLFFVEARAPQTLKGVREPIALYRIVQSSGVRSRLAAAASARGLTPFVGREHERAVLRDRIARAFEGERQVVLIVGEPGIGKSRLAQAIREDLAETPHTWLESGGTPYFANTPFYAVQELLRQGLAWRGDEASELRIAALERRLAVVGLDPAEALPLVAPLLDLPLPAKYAPVVAAPEVQRKRLLQMLASWVFAAARLQPIVIVLEDLQWLDPSTLEYQTLLVEQAATAPVLLLYTARPEFRAPWPLRAHHTQLMLNRLGKKDARALVSAWAGMHAALVYARLADPASAREHAERTLAACAHESNPFAEMVATVVRGWALVEQGKVPEGLALVRSANDSIRSTGQRLFLEMSLGLVAEVEARAGLADAALASLREAETAASAGELVIRIETLVRQATILALHCADPAVVEAAFGDALALARRFGARFYELRAAVRFGRWLRANHRAAEARELLASIYASFTEGFDARDLVEARELLDDLEVGAAS